MSIPATIVYFGQLPTTIIMRTTTAFDGSTPQAGNPVLSPGLYTFAPQAGGGVYNFHTAQIDVKNMTYQGSGQCNVFKVLNGVPTQIATLTGTTNEYQGEPTTLSPGESLSFVSTGSGAAQIAITAMETLSMWSS